MEALSTTRLPSTWPRSAQWEDWGILRRSRRCWAGSIPSPESPPPGLGPPHSVAGGGPAELRLRVCGRVPGASGDALKPERKTAGGGGKHRRSTTEQRAAPEPETRAQNETRISSFPVKEKLPQPARRLGGPRAPQAAVEQAGLHQEFPLSAHPPAPSRQAPRRCWARCRGTAWRGGRCAQEPCLASEVSVLPPPCAPGVPAGHRRWALGVSSVPGHPGWPWGASL